MYKKTHTSIDSSYDVEDLELKNYEYLDQRPYTGYVTSLPIKVVLQKWLVRIDEKESYLQEFEQLSRKVRSLKVNYKYK